MFTSLYCIFFLLGFCAGLSGSMRVFAPYTLSGYMAYVALRQGVIENKASGVVSLLNGSCPGSHLEESIDTGIGFDL